MKKLFVVFLALVLVCSIGCGIYSNVLSAKATEEITEVNIAPSLLAEEDSHHESTSSRDDEISTIPPEPSATIPSESEISEEETLVYQDPEAEQEIESDPYYDEVNETVFTTTAVNVRTGPSTDAEKIGMLNCGAEITRTGIGINGWSKVSFEGQEAYMCSDYLIPSSESNSDDGSISFEDVNETVYATTGVNVRSGPDTSCEKLGMIYRGNSIIRTGIGSNGWSRVTYNGNTAYIHSDYLSTTKPQSEWRAGMHGRLTIPSVGVDVGLYYCTFSSGSKAQRIVNAVDSAAYIDQDYVDGVIIADHYNQGFEAMKKAVPNKTYAYIDYGSYTQTYVCTAIGIGHNYDNDLVDWNGVSLNYDYISGGLAMYTCNENWQNVTISYWKVV